MSNRILDEVINKIRMLDDPCGAPAIRLYYNAADPDPGDISIPRTDRGRQLLRALLVEVGRHECESADAKKEVFVKVRNAVATV